MDTTTLAPPESAWELLAELAACGNDSSVLGDAQALAKYVVELVGAYLPCPWVVFAFNSTGAGPTVASSGISPKEREALVGRSADVNLPHQMVALQVEQAEAGVVWLGASPQLETVLTPKFLEALRRQIELLVTLHRRETNRQVAQLEAARELFILRENGKIITAGLSLDTMLSRVAENVALALRVDRCVIYLRDRVEPAVLLESASYSFDDGASSFPRVSVNGTGPIAEAIESGMVRMVGDDGEHGLVLGFQSALLLPLRSRDAVAGLLVVGFSDEDHVFTRAEIDLAQTLADQIATAVLGVQAREAEQRRTRELDALQELSQRLGVEQPLDDTLHAVVRGVRGFIPFAGAQISLFDAENETILVASRTGLLGGRGTRNSEQRQPLSHGLSGWLGRYRRSLRLSSFERPPVKLEPIWLSNGTAPASYLGMPLLVGEQLVGTIELFGDRAGAFSVDHERLLQLIGTQAAQAIASARHTLRTDAHLRRRVQQLTALQRISRQLTATLSLDLIFSFALEEALQATTATQAFIALRSGGDDGLRVTDADNGDLIATVSLGDEGNDYSILAVAGYGAEDNTLVGQALHTEDTTAGEAISSGEPRLIDEPDGDDRLNGFGPPVATALAMPVYFENQTVGVVSLHSERAHAFDHDTVEFVRALTDQVALALGNALRYEEQQRQRTLLQQRASMLKQVLDIGQALRADASIEELLEQVAFSIVDTAGFRRAIFNVVDYEDGETLRVVTAAGLALSEIERLRNAMWPKGLVDQLLDKRFRLGRCFFVPAEETAAIDAQYDNIEAISSTLEVVASSPNEWQANDELFVPLYSTDARLLGILSVDEPYNRMRPTARSLEAVEVLADQAAIAIENANLLRAARAQTEQVQALYQVGAATVSTLSLEDLLERVYNEIASYMGTPAFFYVASYNESRQTLRFELFKEHGETLQSHTKRIEVKAGLTGWVIDSGKLLDIHDYELEVDSLPVKPVILDKPLRSWVGVPLRSQNKVIGVLSVQSFEPHAFAERHIQFLNSLANQLAVALENARLFQEREQRIAELDAVNEVGRITSTTLDLGELFLAVFDVLQAFMPIDAGYIYDYNEASDEVELRVEIDEGVREVYTQLRKISENSLSRRILQTHQPLLFGDLRAERSPAGVTPITFGNTEKASASWVGVPLLGNDGAVVGVLSVQSYTPNLYGERELAFLQTLASQLALGVQNVRLFTQIKQQVDQLSLLNQASSTAATTLSIEEIYQTAVETMAHAVGADQARVVQYDFPNGVSHIVAELIPTPNIQRDVIPVEKNPSVEWLKQHRRPLVSEDAQNDPIFIETRALFRRLDIQSLALIPLLSSDELVGAVGLDFVGRQHHFTPQTLELCQTIANQLVTAVAKVRLFEATEHNAMALGHKVGELSTLLEAARVLSSSLKPDEVLTKLMDVVGRQLDVDTVGLWTITPDRLLRPAALLGIPQEIADSMTVPVGQGMTGRVASSGAPLVVINVERDGESLYPAFNRERHLTSFMGVPVVYRAETIGVLSVMTVARRDFSADDQALLAGMADQAAIALENARLFQERDRRIAELTSFNRISQRLNATLDLDTLLHVLHEEIGKVLDRSNSFIALFDAATQQISYPIFWEDGRPSDQQIVLHAVNDPSISRYVISERKPVLLRTSEEMARYLREAGWGEERTTDTASWLSVPLVEGDAVFGILNVQSQQPNKFDADDQRFLITVAGVAATAIARAQLFSERERRLAEVSVLQEISSAITSTLNLQDVLERLLAELGRVVDVSTSFIGLYDSSRGVLSYPVAYDHGQRVTFEPLVLVDGLNHWVITNREPLVLGTNEEYEKYRTEAVSRRVGPADLVEQSYLVVPIISGDDALGVINVQSYQIGAFDAEDLRFVSAVANQAAAAINNARLFQDRGRRIEELSTFNDIGRQFSAVPTLNDLLDLIYRQTSRLLDTTNFYIGLYDEYSDVVNFAVYYHEGKKVERSPLTAHNSLSHRVIRTREPFLLQGDDRSGRLGEFSIVPVGPQSRSWLGVPMIANDQVIGLIGIQDYDRGDAYTEEDVRLLSTLASWGAVALANARMFTDQRQSLEELGLLYDLSMQLAGTLDPAEVQRIVVLNAINLLHAPVGALLLFDDKRQVTHQFYFDSDETQATEQHLSDAAAALHPLLLERDKPLMLRDVGETARRDLAEQFNVRGLIGEVIGGREDPQGTIWLADRQQREWQSRELSMLSIITTLASQALKTAYLFEREQTQRDVADTLRDVAQQLTSVLKLDDIYELLLTQLNRIIAYDSASLMMRQAEPEDLVYVVATRGFPEDQRASIEQLQFTLAEDLNMQEIVRTKRPLVLFDAQQTADFVQVEGTEHIRGWIGIPLLLDDEVIGLLTVDSSQSGAYSQEDGQIAFTLASQAAQAIRNARLFEEVRRFNAELEQRVDERTAALAELNKQLGDEKQRLQAVHAITIELTASLELNETLRKTLQLAARTLGVNRGSIMLWDEHERQLVCRAVLGDNGEVYAENIPIEFETGGGLSGWVREHQQPLCISDVRKDKRWVQAQGRASNVRSVVAVPLRAEGVGTLGVLMLTSPVLNYFTPAQEQLLSTIANEVAIVIHNAELYSLVQDYALKLSESFNQQKEETIKNQAILRSLGEGVVVLDEDDKVILFNPAAEGILGIAEADLLGQSLVDIMSYGETPTDKGRTKTIYETLIGGLRSLDRQHRSQQTRLELTHPAQSIELYFTPVVGPDRDYGSVVVLRDVTREIEADRAKRDFISSVSHELRTPLTAIKGYVDLLNLGAAGPITESQGQFLGVVKNNANRLMDLINDILEIGRIDANKIQLNFDPVDIRLLFDDVMQTMRSELERKQMRMKLEIADGIPMVEADERRLTQVVLNLVSNAVKYTYAQGEIELRAGLNPSGMLEVSVSDNGVGMTPEQQQYLFRRFYRADNPLRDEAGGTGLGLSIAKSFIELHGGEMWVRSEIGEGSTFSFVVPVTQPERSEELSDR